MNAKIIDGKSISQTIKDEIKAKVAALDSSKRKPGLAVILVGDDPASHFYVSSKERACSEVGFESFKTVLPAAVTKEELTQVIQKYNQNEQVDGILLQLPLPDIKDSQSGKSLRDCTQEIIDSISPNKDVDGLHTVTQGKLVNFEETIEPCTPKGCMELLKRSGINPEGQKVIVVGRSSLVGKPIALMLCKANATVTIAHSRTKNLEQEVGAADIVIAAIGKKEFIPGAWIKEGAVLIDVGINAVPNPETGKSKLYGDISFEDAAQKASYITPVPGGVGPMTISMLLQNTLDLYLLNNQC